MSTGTRSDIAITSQMDKKVEAGIGGGVFVAFTPVRHLTFQPEFLYVQKHVRDEQNGFLGFRAVFKLDYVEIPLLVKYCPTLFHGRITPAFFAGPYTSFLSTAHATTEGHIPSNYATSEDIKKKTSHQDFGITIGAGLGYRLGRGEVLMDARYDLGLSNVRNPAIEYYETPWIVHLRSVIVMVGFKLDF